MTTEPPIPDTWYSRTVGLVQRNQLRELVMVETGRVLLNLPTDAKRLISESDMRRGVAKALREAADELTEGLST